MTAIAWARLYVEPVERAGAGIEAAVRDMTADELTAGAGLSGARRSVRRAPAGHVVRARPAVTPYGP